MARMYRPSHPRAPAAAAVTPRVFLLPRREPPGELVGLRCGGTSQQHAALPARRGLMDAHPMTPFVVNLYEMEVNLYPNFIPEGI
ncbi:hypothetical protein THAOC_33162, partial [Thalassiosira oceanica]